jgi:hypothetical protein
MIEYIIAFIAGALVKFSDHLEDEVKGISKNLRIFAGVIYGIPLGWLLSGPLAPLWAGVLFAQLVSGKIDKLGHMLGVASAIVFWFIFGFNSSFALRPEIIFFFVLAWLDEIPFRWNSDLRLFLKLGCLAFAMWNPAYLFGIIALDLGYLASNEISMRYVKSPNAS